ncbi:MAG: anti-sigma regulatory factor [Actinomycetota bacterium]
MASEPDRIRIPIVSDLDLVAARQAGRRLAQELGFSSTDQTLIATAISEVTRNIVQHATRGEVVVSRIHEPGRQGVLVVAQDAGPGIPDVDLALREGYTTGGGLGLGLPGARRLMEEFELSSEVGKGTTVVMKKWTPSRG